MIKILIDRAVVEQALHVATAAGYPVALIAALKAALAQQAEPTIKECLQVESVATTQQRVAETPPSDYRRGYWDGFNIGKREGRIEAEDAMAQQAWVCPESPEHLYAKPGHCEDCGRTLVLAQQAEQKPCSTDPRAPHGFDRTASHTAGRYVCECEHWQAEHFCDTHCTWADHAAGCVRAEPVQEPDDKADSIRWQLCLLAQTEEFSDEVRNQIGRGVWLIDRLTEAALAEPQEPDSPERRCGGPGCDGTCCQPVQEPVAWMTVRLNVPIQTTARKDVADEWLKWGEVLPLYTAPQQRNPVGWDGRCMLGHCNSPAGCENSGECRAVERAHGIGGEG